MEVKIRQVWSQNLESEFGIIRSIVDEYPLISMDTEFPGVIFKSPDDSALVNYSFLKRNVDCLHIIQVGLTFANVAGNLPTLGSNKHTYIWQFNFKDFDVSRDSHSPSSIDLLRNHGMDFARNVKEGVDSCRFSELMMSSGLVCNDSVTWITFHCPYDFGYLVKVLTQRELPSRLSEFRELVRVLFGEKVFDVKYILRPYKSLWGALEVVAQMLGVVRTVGTAHQAGSDSWLTWMVFQKIRDRFFDGNVDKFADCLYGLGSC